VLSLLGAYASAGQNLFYFFSDPGDYIGAGQEVIYTGAEATFGGNDTFGNGVSLSVITPGFEHWWFLEFAPVTGPIQPGVYEQAQRWPFQATGHPGLSVSGEGRGCNTLTGTFKVLEVVRDPATDVLQSFAVDYEQHCEGFTAAMYGQLRFNSDVPLSGKPIRVQLDKGLNAQGCIEAAGPTGTPVTATAESLSDAGGGTALRYEWTTTSGANGAGPLFTFLAPLKPASLEPTILTLTVTDLTTNAAKTVTKSVCVSDTTAPTIAIIRPRPGDVIRGDDLALDVSVKDAVDKNINRFEVFTGSNFVSPLNPVTGRSHQLLLEKPRADGSITTTITVRARDAGGNASEQSVTVSLLPDKRH
jgi:hypothetical protein